MPNWCSNTLTISGKKKEDLDEFKKKVDTDHFLNGFIPMPQELDTLWIAPHTDRDRKNSIKSMQLINKYKHDNWYDWRISNWGCKWDVEIYSNPKALNKETVVHYEFESPWSPPCEAIQEISRLYPKLKFKIQFSEPGNGLKGTIKYQNGIEL